MHNQNWNVVFLKLGHYVASKNTKYGELIILCSDSEQLPTQKFLAMERDKHRESILHGRRLKPAIA